MFVFSSKLKIVFTALLYSFFSYGVFSLELIFPLKCDVGSDCYLQYYVDHDLGSNIQDYQCGKRSTPNQKGTSIRLADTNVMLKGFEVLAASAGKVVTIQNDIPDQVLTEEAKQNLQGRECGNNVVLDHGGGWQTRYCHMMRSSVIVTPGESVSGGQALGLLGLSGFTTYPHLEFFVIRDDQFIDPFYPEENVGECGQTDNSLWKNINSLPYHDSKVISSGFSDAVPALNQVVLGSHHPAFLPRSIQRLAFWIQVIGAQKDDIHSIIIYNQRNQIIAESSNNVLGADQSVGILSIVHELKSGNLAPGLYKGSFVAERVVNGKKMIIEQHDNQIVLQ